MNLTFVTAPTSVTVLLALLVPASATAQTSLELKLEPVLSTSLSGIPVVVQLTYRNGSQVNVETWPLRDGYMDWISWHWASDGRESYQVTLKDLHFGAIPAIGLGLKTIIKPGQKRGWYSTIPTPSKFGDGVKWTLTATVKNLENPEEAQRVAATIVGRDPAVSVAADRLGASWAQAGLLEWPRDDVMYQFTRDKKLGILEECSRKGDRAADLILFSRALYEKIGVVRRCQALEDAPDEIKCLRNYLLFRPLEDVRGVITEGEAEAIRTSITAKSPLGTELLERIERRRR